MIVNITLKDGDVVSFETDQISDDQKKITANTIIRKVATLEIMNESLVIASQVHRSTLEDLLMNCDEAKIEKDSND
tara:strand:- start:103 stop:330 length:228 start_codon:yes stop_codon:yes gene_type:complete